MRTFKNFEDFLAATEAPAELNEYLTYDALFRMSEPKRFDRSLTVKMPPLDMQQYQTPEKWVFEYYFNAKGNPSTTGLRHRGYVRFIKPRKTQGGKNTPLSKLNVEVDCMCPDYKYRFSWANHQRGAGPIGPKSLNQCINQAPRKTNPTGAPGLCIAEGELISTKRGYIPIQNVNKSDHVWTLDGWQHVLDSGCTGTKNTVKLTLRSGRTLKLTPEHQVFAFRTHSGFEWIPAKNLSKEHHLCIAPPSGLEIKPVSFKVREFTSWNKKLHYPQRTVIIDETLAELIGYMVAEGSTNFFAAETELLQHDFAEKWKKVFGENSVSPRKNGCYIGFHGTRILGKLGFKFGSYAKEVPPAILRSNKSIITAFLRGCYAGDGNFRNRHSTYGTVSEKLARQLHLLLATIGVSTSLNLYKQGEKKSPTWVIRTSSGEDTHQLFSLLNPLRGYSTPVTPGGKPPLHNYIVLNPPKLFQSVISRTFPVCQNETLVPVNQIGKYIPECSKMSIVALAKSLSKSGQIKKARLRRGGKMSNMASLHDLFEITRDYRAAKITKQIGVPPPAAPWKTHRLTLAACTEKLKYLAPEAFIQLKHLVREDLFFDQVSAVDPAETCPVYDLTVAKSEHFTANGLVVHNCKHILATRDYIYGLLSGFPAGTGDTQKLDALTKKATQRWLNFDQEMDKARERDDKIAASKARRNIGLPPEDQNQPIAAIAADEPPDLPAEGPAAPAPVKPTKKGTAVKPAKPTVKPQPKPATKTPKQPKPVDFLTHRFNRVESVDIATNMKTNRYTSKSIQDCLKLVEDMENEIETGESPVGLPGDEGEFPPSTGGDMPVEPPVSDSAVGASTEDNLALSLLREIRDLLAELTNEEAGEELEGEELDLPPEGSEEGPHDGEEGETEDDDEQFKPGKRPMPVSSGAE